MGSTFLQVHMSHYSHKFIVGTFTALAAATAIWGGVGQAQQISFDAAPENVQELPLPPNTTTADEASIEDRALANEDALLPTRLKRQIVEYPTQEPAGTIIVDTQHTNLFYVLGDGRAIRYGIGVGRKGFTWSGVKKIARKSKWPDWYPPPEMIQRQPYLPRMMTGGPGNPLGARAMYIAGTEYRIHGTNDPNTIGQNVSSGCIRLTNNDVIDLYNRVKVGAKVIVLSQTEAVPQSRPVSDRSSGAGISRHLVQTPPLSGVLDQTNVSWFLATPSGLY